MYGGWRNEILINFLINEGLFCLFLFLFVIFVDCCWGYVFWEICNILGINYKIIIFVMGIMK